MLWFRFHDVISYLIEAEWRIYALATQAIIGSDNGLSPVRHQTINWTNAGILSIEPLGTNVSEILIEIQIFSFKKMHFENIVCEMASIVSRPQCVICDFLEHGNIAKVEQHIFSLQNTAHSSPWQATSMRPLLGAHWWVGARKT